ncbi:MAG: DUF2828 domain-containing protein [Lachnospiraceae bacterium]|nr:DUF2828 domain-containing protein [Lachnospiraceae bacterium]
MYGSTGKALLDLNFSVSNMRDMEPDLKVEKFMAAFNEDPITATKWLFFARDIRGGLGERDLFRHIFCWFATYQPNTFRHLVSYIPEYGRWDDLLELCHTSLEREAFRVISKQFWNDLDSMKANRSVSLLAKWMPSINATSADQRRLALKLCKYLGINVASYRKLISKLRKYIDIVEQKMSANQWDQIEYSKVPSRANMLYKDAFLRHDRERREEFLSAALKGEVKMNSGTLFPHEIIHQYAPGGGWDFRYNPVSFDPSMEVLWNNLPPLEMESKTIVVQDGSGSMLSPVSEKSEVRCMDVAMGLALYFAQNLTGPYANRVITFSEHPQFVDLNGYNTLADKINHLKQYTEVANTNIEAVFDLILETAVNNHLSQEDLPSNILIISDMEFDHCAQDSSHHYYGQEMINPNLFEEIARKYASYGYKIPRCCFWNTKGRSGAIPMIQNDLGVALMSGFSVNNAKMIMSGKMDPYEALLDVLNSERYADIYPAIPDQC